MELVDHSTTTSWVWADVCCVSQIHRALQELAIQSLPIYAALSSVFVVVAPITTHHDTGNVCDITTYSKCGWCRAELFSKLSVGGTDHMYKMCSMNGKIEEMENTVNAVTDFNSMFNVRESLAEPRGSIEGVQKREYEGAMLLNTA